MGIKSASDSSLTDSEEKQRGRVSRIDFMSSAAAQAPPSSRSRPPRSGSRSRKPGSRHGLMLSLSPTAFTSPQDAHPPSPRHYFHGAQHSVSSSSEGQDDTESLALLLDSTSGDVHWRDGRAPTWWPMPRGRRRRSSQSIRALHKFGRRVLRHPLFPARPPTILLTLILFIIFAISLTSYLMWYLNPDKEPLPWRAYCSIPSLQPPREHPNPLRPFYPEFPAGEAVPSFPPPHLESLPPAGLFVGVMTIDSSFERRMLIRSTWASHNRSRNGAGTGDGGRGTSRTIVRFILGQPRPDWEQRIKLEMETYNDIVILPMKENMNSGKTHSLFSWASLNAWVPPILNASEPAIPHFSYSNYTASPPPLAQHDPPVVWENMRSEHPAMWVRPDFVLKVDDDAFVMLAELEARLRVELHSKPEPIKDLTKIWPRDVDETPSSSNPSQNAVAQRGPPSTPLTDNDPLIYWGYMITNKGNQFMAGELYALSWSLVDWAAKDAQVKTMTVGAEDKMTANWMRVHPRAEKVRWTSERCWIYDHPRAGTVYSHGFLFPSEVTRVKKEMSSYLENAKRVKEWEARHPHAPGLASTNNTLSLEENIQDMTAQYGPPAIALSHSSVSRWKVRYTPPAPNLTERESVEALVEGSLMSKLRRPRPGADTENPTSKKENKSVVSAPLHAWQLREGRKTQYEGKRVGGTVVVHYIKKSAWYMETALALLEGEEETNLEKLQSAGVGQGEEYYGRL